MPSPELPSDLIPPELTVDVEPFSRDTLEAALSLIGPPADWEDDAAPVPGTEPVRRFAITDDDLAEWAMAHVAEIDANREMIEEQFAARVARLDRWRRTAIEKLERHREFFEFHLVEYARRYRAQDPKRNKTLSLPSGSVESTETKPKVSVADEAVLADWVSENLPDSGVAKWRPKVYLSELRKHVAPSEVLVGSVLRLSCGHTVEVPLADEDGERIDVSGPTFPCPVCPASDESAEVLERDPLHRLEAHDEWGRPVPGADVVPSSIRFRVRPS